MKKKYEEPKLTIVKLSPEQAVLFHCSGATSNPKQGAGLYCHAPGSPFGECNKSVNWDATFVDFGPWS